MIPCARLFILIGFLLITPVTRAIAQNTRVTAFVSDTHLGVRKIPNGRWHAYEDARWAQDFRLFLEELREVKTWQNRQFDSVYSIIYLDAIQFKNLRLG